MSVGQLRSTVESMRFFFLTVVVCCDLTMKLYDVSGRKERDFSVPNVFLKKPTILSTQLISFK